MYGFNLQAMCLQVISVRCNIFRGMLTGASGVLVKQLKIVKKKRKLTLKTIFFQVSISNIHNFKKNISFYNFLTNVPEHQLQFPYIYIIVLRHNVILNVKGHTSVVKYFENHEYHHLQYISIFYQTIDPCDRTGHIDKYIKC